MGFCIREILKLGQLQNNNAMHLLFGSCHYTDLTALTALTIGMQRNTYNFVLQIFAK